MRKFEADYLLERIKNIILDSQDIGNCIDNDIAFEKINKLFQSKIELDPFYNEDHEKQYYEKFKQPLELNELSKVETAHQLTECYHKLITYSTEKLHLECLKSQERWTYYDLLNRMDELLHKTTALLKEDEYETRNS